MKRTVFIWTATFFTGLAFFIGTQNSANAELVHITPQNACGLLHQEGFPTKTDWKHYGGGVWGCNSDMIRTDSNTILSNNIAYYAEGKKNKVEALKILVNINNREKAKDAINKLYESTFQLFNKSSGGQSPPTTFMNAVRIGGVGNATTGKTSIKLERSNWTTGKGYDLKITIR